MTDPRLEMINAQRRRMGYTPYDDSPVQWWTPDGGGYLIKNGGLEFRRPGESYPGDAQAIIETLRAASK